MSEDTTIVTEGTQTAPVEQPTPPAEAKNTDTPPAEHMIPKTRFDEVNSQLKELRTQFEEQEKARQKAETDAAKEQGKFKELYEKAQAELTERDEKLRGMELDAMRKQVAADAGLPATFADRIRGNTQEEMAEDAKGLLAALPKPAAPNTNSSSGPGARPVPGQRTEAEKQAFAAIYGVNPAHVQ